MLRISLRFSFIFTAVFIFIISGLVALRPTSLSADGPPPPDVDIDLIDILPQLNRPFDNPVHLTHAGDGSERLFVVEQDGIIRIIEQGTLLPTPFLDIDSLVQSGGERGLLSMAFHPDYENNGFFYVNYTRNGGDTVIARYSVSTDTNIADPNSGQTVLVINQPQSNHNGGQIAFGADGYLYIGMGDGGGSGDPNGEGQNKNTLLGAMLRLDVNGVITYTIPADNPYISGGGAPEIWAIGLRNPWRFSFDRDTGDLYIGDVGQGQREEIDFQAYGTPGGLNFGWDCKEGSLIYTGPPDGPSPLCGEPGSLVISVDPIAEYGRSEGQSVTGGFVYRGMLYPDLRERYFFADYQSGKIWSIYRTHPISETWSEMALELSPGFSISSFGEDEAGELYVIDYSGTVYRLASAQGPQADLSQSYKMASSSTASVSEIVTYTIRLVNHGAPLTNTVYFSDTLPSGLLYQAGSLNASAGTINDAQNPTLRWQGILSGTTPITISYSVIISPNIAGGDIGTFYGTFKNQAILTDTTGTLLTLSHILAVGTPYRLYLPLVLK